MKHNTVCQSILLYAFSSNTKHRRGVAPVIATLLLVAIATIGGSVTFVYSQDNFNTTQISTSTEIEYLKVVGYDARDVEKLLFHDGNEIEAKNCCGVEDGEKKYHERIAIYIQNKSPQDIVVSELLIAGDEYAFMPAPKIGEWDKIGNGHKPHPGEYIIVNGHLGGKEYSTVEDGPAVIRGGGLVTVLLDLGNGMIMHDKLQIKITTSGGNVFVSDLQVGQHE